MFGELIAQLTKLTQESAEKDIRINKLQNENIRLRSDALQRDMAQPKTVGEALKAYDAAFTALRRNPDFNFSPEACRAIARAIDVYFCATTET